MLMRQAEAKIQLINDVDSMKLSSKRPYIPLRRDSEARLAREVDDIISLFTFVDENKAMNLLPKYVSSSPDNMPSLRLYDGDLNVILSWMKNIGTRIERFEEVMAAICRDVKELQVTSCDQLVQSTRTATRGSATARSVNKPTPVVSTEPLPTDGNSFAHVADVNSEQLMNDPVNWATVTSIPYCSENRFAVLSTDDEGNGESRQQSAYTTVVRRRNSTKRLRQHTSPQQTPNNRQTTSQEQQQRQPRRVPAVIGTS